MRDILFRGKSTYDNEWIEGDLIYYDTNEYLILEQGFGLWDTQHDGVPVCKNTIGQYTGVKDKHGVKIFEGDIVEYKLNGKFDGIGRVVYKDCQFYVKDKLEEEYRLVDLDKGYSIEVVGNIHNNKDLIK